MTSVSVSFGYGKHLYDITQDDLNKMPIVANIAGFFSILAALLSKTSFAITLARISEGWILRLIWTIIISMTLIMGSSAVLVWIAIPMGIRITYYVFSSSGNPSPFSCAKL
jgi:hypothetical protein